jgi:hypothetical protein
MTHLADTWEFDSLFRDLGLLVHSRRTNAERLNGLFLDGSLLDLDFLAVAGLETGTIFALSDVNGVMQVVVVMMVVNVYTNVCVGMAGSGCAYCG